MAENIQCLQEVYNSMVHECTSFNFVKIHLMLHHEESGQRFGHLVNDSPNMREMNGPTMCLGRYPWSNRNFPSEQQLLYHYSHIDVLGKC